MDEHGSKTNNYGELAAIIATLNATPPYQPLKIITDSEYVIDGLTNHLENWENDGWISIKNSTLFKKAAHLLRIRSARTIFQWTKGHNGNRGNEESDCLAKRGAKKNIPDRLDMEIPEEFDIQGAKLATLTQAKAYRGILERKKIEPRNTTRNNIQLTREAINQTLGTRETEATIWRNLRKPIIKPIIQQFLYKTMHGTHMIGKYWRNISRHEHREECTTCNTTESMEHILTTCRERTTQLVWTMARNLWPHDNTPWPNITLGTILGCGCISLRSDQRHRENNEQNGSGFLKGPTRLLQIIISESAYLIWVLRCERVIQSKEHSEDEIQGRWLRAINERLTTDKITAIRIIRKDGFTTLVVNTWEQALEKERELPPNWINCSEVLVGRTA